jgi:prepilin-type N-terminal cleavage/methylation domain-containing protein
MQKRGFTLIELLVTIVIIGLLTTVATTSFLTAQRNARDGARRTSLTAIGSAVEAYKLVESRYPGVVTPNASDPALTTKCAINETYYFSPSANCPTPSFDPKPNWIPGLGKYLTPTPIEKRYLGTDGLESSLGSFSIGASDAGTPSLATRTYSYKRTATGYSAYVRIEGNACGASTTCSIGK